MNYEKLVRDKIPETIARQGKHVYFRALSGDELKAALKDKLIEEAKELADAETPADIIEEMADVMEVLHALIDEYGYANKVNKARMNKAIVKGDFSRGYYLEHVDEEMPCKHALKDELGDLYCGNDESENWGDFCVSCGKYAGEGRHICVSCEKKTHLNE